MKKTKGKTAVIVISCLLVVLMGVSLIASIGRSGSGASSGVSPGGSDSTIDSGGGGSGGIEDEEDGSCLHRDANDDSACDYCGEVFTDGSDKVFGGKTLASYTFDPNEVTLDSTGDYYNGDIHCHLEYGNAAIKDGYLKFYTDSSDTSYSLGNQPYLSIDFSTSYINPTVYRGSIDYLTIDFDLFTDSEYVKSCVFAIFGEDSSSSRVYSNGSQMKVYTNSAGDSWLTINGKEFDLNFTDLTSEPVHITYVLKIDHTDMTKTKVKVYLNGEFITEESTTFSSSDFRTFTHMRFLIDKNAPESDKSICIDNFEVNSFGNGKGYDGYLSETFETNGSLTECADSILFDGK